MITYDYSYQLNQYNEIYLFLQLISIESYHKLNQDVFPG